jgi:hypothetical protein
LTEGYGDRHRRFGLRCHLIAAFYNLEEDQQVSSLVESLFAPTINTILPGEIWEK